MEEGLIQETEGAGGVVISGWRDWMTTHMDWIPTRDGGSLGV